MSRPKFVIVSDTDTILGIAQNFEQAKTFCYKQVMNEGIKEATVYEYVTGYRRNVEEIK